MLSTAWQLVTRFFWNGRFMGSRPERRLMKALAGCSNKEQIIISSHCPQPDSPQQPPSFLTHPSAKMLIGTINDMMRKGLLGLLRRTLIDLQVKFISIIIIKEWTEHIKDIKTEGKLNVASNNSCYCFQTYLSCMSFGMQRVDTSPSQHPHNLSPPSIWLHQPSTFYLKIFRQCPEDPIP